MADLRAFFQPMPADYPNHLAGPEPQRRAFPTAPWLLAGLVALCLVPRVLMALKTEIVCPDGVLYIQLAQALNKGDFEGGLQEMHLNTFPVLLVALHRLGLEWELGGKAWGVVISSLVVLPLYGWARRQFDERVALVACLLYAVHANLIEWSPELIRGPTFWFLFVLSIYLLWRAVTEVRWGLFAAAGGAITLASLTRVEGLFLLIPLVLWSASRCQMLRQARARLLWGTVLGVLCFPALLLLVNLIWLRGYPHWEFIRSAPLGLVPKWWQSMAGAAVGAAAESGHGGAVLQARMSLPQSLWLFVHTMERGMTPFFALLMFGGNWVWRRVWWRCDTRPLIYVALAVATGMWIHLCEAQVSSYRYPLAIVLMGSVFAALGLLGLSAWMLRLAQRLHCGNRLQWVIAVAPLVIVAATGWADALTKNYEVRQSWARLGYWAQQEFGPAPALIGPEGLVPTASYYARGRCCAFPNNMGGQGIMLMARQFQPDLVLLWARQVASPGGEALVEQIEKLGFRHVAGCELPPGTERVFVLAQTDANLRIAQRSARRSGRLRGRPGNGSHHQG
jgi:hypothetical protein